MLCDILPALCFWCGQAFDSFLLKSACEDGSDRLEKYSTDLMSGDVEQQVMGEAVRTALNLAAEQSQAAEALRPLAGPVCNHCASGIIQYQQFLRQAYEAESEPDQLVEHFSDGDLRLPPFSVVDQMLVGRRPLLIYAACRMPWGLEDFIQMILQAGAEVNSTRYGFSGHNLKFGQDGQAAIFAAVEADSPGALWVLLAHKARLDLKTGEQRLTSLHLAAEGGGLKAASFLAANGADVNAVDKYGRTALHLAARFDYRHQWAWDCGQAKDKARAEIIHTLIKAGAEVDARDRNGINPLRTATKSAYPPAVAALLECGVADFFSDAEKANLVGMAETMLKYAKDNCRNSPPQATHFTQLADRRQKVLDVLLAAGFAAGN